MSSLQSGSELFPGGGSAPAAKSNLVSTTLNSVVPFVDRNDQLLLSLDELAPSSGSTRDLRQASSVRPKLDQSLLELSTAKKKYKLNDILDDFRS